MSAAASAPASISSVRMHAASVAAAADRHRARARPRGSRRSPAGSAARTGSRAAARPATAARPRSAPAAGRRARRARGTEPSRPDRVRHPRRGRRPRRPCRSRRAARRTSPATRSANPATTPRSWVIISTPAPVTSRAVCSTSRICAWIVTSSAVVGSSPMITSGSLAIAIAIITRWRIAAGELVRERASRAAPAFGDADEVEQLDRALRAPPRVSTSLVDADAPRRSGRRRCRRASAPTSGPGRPSPMRLPRIRDICWSDRPSSSSPCSRTDPDTSAYSRQQAR